MRTRLLVMVALLLSAQPAWAQASRTFLQAANSTADLTTYTLSTQNFGTASADRHIIAVLASYRTGLSAATIDSVTIGGVAATVVVQDDNLATNTSICGIAIAAVPTGTSGDVVVTFNAGMSLLSLQLYASTGANATAHDTDFNVAADPSVALDIPANGFSIGCATNRNSVTEIWTGLTEDSAVVADSLLDVSSASDNFATTQTGLTITCDYNLGAGAHGVFASWGPAAAGVTPRGPLLQVGP